MAKMEKIRKIKFCSRGKVLNTKVLIALSRSKFGSLTDRVSVLTTSFEPHRATPAPVRLAEPYHPPL